MKGEHRGGLVAKNEKQSSYEFDGAMGDQIMGTSGETEIWRGSEQDEDLIADSSIFNNVFPTLPDFPCMSSSSSSSSTPALTKQFVSSSNSSTSSASSAVMKPDMNLEQRGLRRIKYEVDAAASALSCTDGSGGMEYVDCMDVMEDFGYMDLNEDGNDGWDPSSIFQDDDNQIENQGGLKQEPENREDGSCYMIEGGKEVVKEKTGLDELGVIFFEWLKTNKEHISAEDMKNIKFKKATIECAYKRMGSTKEGKKELLKLILEWVEQYQLSKKRSREEAAAVEASTSHQVPCQSQKLNTNPNPNPKSDFMNFIPTPDPNACMWIPKTQTSIDPEMVMPGVSAPPAVAFHQYPFVGGANVAPMNCQPYAPQMPQTEYQMLESARSWPRSQFVLAPHQYNSFTDQNGNFVPIAPQPAAVNGEQYPSQVYDGTNNSESVVRLAPSATKEARKKRMARKKRGSFHRHHPHQNQIQKIDSPQQSNEGKVGAENCTSNIYGQSNHINWLYWPPIGTSQFPQPPMGQQSPQLESHLGYSTLPQSNRSLAQSDRGGKQLKKQGFKGEKNLKFLLQKVLKQSDVGSLGRIVLPKKEAETQLPQLEERDGIQIVMEDIGTSKMWNLRYRFWPNNKSRMYVLENTGEFVKANGLQEGDFIVIYSDIKYGKYLIRGVKVRQPVIGKYEAKATRKNQYNSGGGTDVPLHAPSKLNGQ